MNPIFGDVSGADLAQLAREMPLCWIVPHALPEAAILMPVILELGADGLPASVLGHLPRGCPAARSLAMSPRASLLFLGANAYVSPSMAGKRDWAPTWNFVSARVTGEISLDAELTRESVEAIVGQQERPGGWRVEELGARGQSLLSRIIGFRLAVDQAAPRFKLGQDEEPGVRASIAAALAHTPLGRWLERA